MEVATAAELRHHPQTAQKLPQLTLTSLCRQPWEPPSSLGPPRVVALAEIGSQQLYFDIATQPALGPFSSLGPPRVVALAEIDSQQLYFDIATQQTLGPSSSLGPPRVVALAEIGSQQLYYDIATQPALEIGRAHV